jgi:hypothetical protein
MSRTTLDLDSVVLAELQAISDQEKRPLDELVSELLALALKTRQPVTAPSPGRLRWHSQDMGPRVDLADKEAVAALLSDSPPSA